MLIFKDSSGVKFTAHTHVGIVRQMRQSAWVAPGKAAYMQDVANRIKVLDGGKSVIETLSPQSFLESLTTYGWLKQLQ